MIHKDQDREATTRIGGTFKLFELFIDLLRVILGPILIIFLFVSLQQPLYNLVESLPYLLTISSEISVAGVSLKIDQKLQAEGSPQARVAASNLSKDSLLYLLDLGKYGSSDLIRSKSEYFTKKERESLEELERRKPAFFRTNVDNEDEYDTEYGPTDLGVEVYDLIEKVLVEQFIYKG